MSDYYAYILTNHTRMLYIGMTDDLRRRTFEHKTGFFADSFTDRYRVNMLVYFEIISDVIEVAARERQLKGWSRKKKITLIERNNPQWVDLSDRWFTRAELESGLMRDLPDENSTTSVPLRTGVSPTPS